MNTQEADCLKAARLFSVRRGVRGSSPLNTSLVLLSYRVCVTFLNSFRQFQFLFRFLCMQFSIPSGVVIVAFILGQLLIGGKVIMVESSVSIGTHQQYNTLTVNSFAKFVYVFEPFDGLT